MFVLADVRSRAPEGHVARHHSPQALGAGRAGGAGTHTPLRPLGSQHDGSGHPIVYQKKTPSEIGEEFTEEL